MKTLYKTSTVIEVITAHISTELGLATNRSLCDIEKDSSICTRYIFTDIQRLCLTRARPLGTSYCCPVDSSVEQVVKCRNLNSVDRLMVLNSQ